MPIEPTRTLEDVVWLLASNLVTINQDLLQDVVETLESADGKLTAQADQLRSLMSLNEENQANLNDIAATLSTQFAEVLAKLDDLESQPGAEALDFTPLRAAVQQVADTVPDP